MNSCMVLRNWSILSLTPWCSSSWRLDLHLFLTRDSSAEILFLSAFLPLKSSASPSMVFPALISALHFAIFASESYTYWSTSTSFRPLLPLFASFCFFTLSNFSLSFCSCFRLRFLDKGLTWIWSLMKLSPPNETVYVEALNPARLSVEVGWPFALLLLNDDLRSMLGYGCLEWFKLTSFAVAVLSLGVSIFLIDKVLLLKEFLGFRLPLEMLWFSIRN